MPEITVGYSMNQLDLVSYSRTNSALARSVAFRRVGPMHKAMCRPCDDFGDVLMLPDQGRIILACADGLGSASNSRIGSQLAVTFALNQTADAMQGVKLTESEVVLRTVANRTREYVRQIAGAVQSAEAGNEIGRLSSALYAQRYGSYARRWLSPNDQAQIFQFLDRWNDHYLSFSTTFFLAIIEESYARVCFVGDGSVGIIRKVGQPTIWMHDRELPGLKLKNGNSFTQTIWDAIKISDVLECAALTLVTDGYARFFNVGVAAQSTPDLPGTHSGGEDEIDVSEFICDDDGSDRSRQNWYLGRGIDYQSGWKKPDSLYSPTYSQMQDPLPGELPGEQGGGWLKSLFGGVSRDPHGVEPSSSKVPASSEPSVQIGKEVPPAAGPEMSDGEGSDTDVSGKVPVETNSANPGVVRDDATSVDTARTKEVVPVVQCPGAVSGDTPVVGKKTETRLPVRTESNPPSQEAVRKNTPAKVKTLPVEEIEPFRHLVDGTAIIGNPATLNQLMTIPTRKSGDDETCISGAIIPNGGLLSDVCGHGMEETSNLRVMYGFQSTATTGTFVKAVAIQPEVALDQLVVAAIVSLENASYERAQRVGSLALQLLCEAIVRSRGKGCESALLDVFRQVVTTRNQDGLFANIALVVHDSKEAHYWCTGRFIALADSVVRIAPDNDITFGKFKVPFLLSPIGNEPDILSAATRLHARLTSSEVAGAAQVSPELVSMVANDSASVTFLASLKVADKELQLAKRRTETGVPSGSRTSAKAPAWNGADGSSAGSKQVKPENKQSGGVLPVVDRVPTVVPRPTTNDVTGPSNQNSAKVNPPVGQKVSEDGVDRENIPKSRRKVVSEGPTAIRRERPESTHTERGPVDGENNGSLVGNMVRGILRIGRKKGS